ncbi:hypothetical protein [Streptomyces sp. SAS_270]|uniref:hypothetical protein n=1 Tax=Streptomyces sp. SAS_270 TaxID=3412748 RepID=UPI00403C4484
MRKRLRTTLAPALALSFTFTAAALSLVPATATATALTNPRPSCSAPGARDFPVRTRIHGGPAGFDVGGGFGTWYIDLTNTTAHTCGGVHPVVVLVDEKRALRPEQARLEFYAGKGGRPHPVAFERSDEDENIGVFDDGFPGFTVGPGRTLTVKVRLSVTSDAAVPNDVVANAAVVQRHGDDGDWVGESNPYKFRIENDGGDGDGVVDGPRVPGSNDGGARKESAGELARTGHPATVPYGLAAAAGVLAAGAALFAVSRRLRLRRR